MLKSVLLSVLTVALIGIAATDTLGMQRDRQRLLDERKVPLSAKPEAEALHGRLRSEALEPEALRDLSTLSPERSVALLRLAEQISRREPVTQLVLLQTSAKSGDLDATLAHYDVLLSTEPKETAQLQAQLADGLQNREIADKVRLYAGRRWFSDFLAAASSSAADPRPLATLLRKARRISEASDRLTPRLLDALVRKGYPADAFRLAASVADSAGKWRAFAVSTATTDERLTPLTWAIPPDPRAFVSFEAGGIIALSVEPLTTARVLRRVTNLTPGPYALTQTVTIPAAPAPSLEWRMTCLQPAPAALAWRRYLTTYNSKSEQVDILTVPAGCPFQEWTLWAVGADTQTASSAKIEALSLLPR